MHARVLKDLGTRLVASQLDAEFKDEFMNDSRVESESESEMTWNTDFFADATVSS